LPHSQYFRVTSAPVVIVVGEEKEKVYVHAHLLKATSKYFVKMLDAQQEGDQMQKVKLQDSDASAFNIYAKWLYTGRFHLTTCPDTNSDGTSQGMCWDEILNCYVLAHNLESSDFSAASIDAFLLRMEIKNESPADLGKWIYPRTTAESEHRRLCQDIVLHTWKRKHIHVVLGDDYPRQFGADVFARMSAKFKRGMKRKEVQEFLEGKNECEYHEHKRLDLPCYKLRLGA
jgi:hypothetical protein